MSYDVYWVKNRAEKIADFEHPTLRGTICRWRFFTYPQRRCFAASSGFSLYRSRSAELAAHTQSACICGCVATAGRHSLLS